MYKSIAVWLVLGVLGLAAAGAAEGLQERVLAHARTITGGEYAFTRTVRTEQSGGEGPKERVMVERFDPTKGAASRWTLLTVDGRAPTAEEAKAHAKEAPKRPVAGYARLANYIGAPATASADAKGRTVFRFASLPKNSVLLNNVDLSANSTCEAVVDQSGAQPFVQQVRSRLTKPTRLKLVAKIENLEAATTYRLMPDGVPVPVEQTSEMSGSMMGKEGRIRTRISYSDHRRVGR
ncbi:hypothetical protein BH20VER2_BH20VER2_05900 [soil metagenome]|nr:hypothetical protein [Chthoniobacterales bacterium]